MRPVHIAATRKPIRQIAPGYFSGTPCYNNPSYSGSFFCSGEFGSVFSHRRPNSNYGGFVPIYSGYPLDYEPGADSQPTVPEQENSLTPQVQALTDEVESLREEQESQHPPYAYAPMRPAAAPRESSVERPTSTTFVYRDGKQLEAQNYAILGQTLWVFGDHSTRKIPLTDLDLNATQKLNEDRGVDFVPPSGL